jgi:hypothetical protein
LIGTVLLDCGRALYPLPPFVFPISQPVKD